MDIHPPIPPLGSLERRFSIYYPLLAKWIKQTQYIQLYSKRLKVQDQLGIKLPPSAPVQSLLSLVEGCSCPKRGSIHQKTILAPGVLSTQIRPPCTLARLWLARQRLETVNPSKARASRQTHRAQHKARFPPNRVPAQLNH